MFGFARVIIRNKILVVAVILVGVFLARGDREAPKPSSPWGESAGPAAVAVGPAKESITDKALKVADGAAEKVGMADYAPSQMLSKSPGSADKAGSVLSQTSDN